MTEDLTELVRELLAGGDSARVEAARKRPVFDRAPVPGADLDADLVADFLATVRDRDPDGLGRFDDDAELLSRAGITAGDGTPTAAGTLALGVHPQQFFPRYVVNLAADPYLDDPPGVRARNHVVASGPIPLMLDTAVNWARRTFDTLIVGYPDGTVRDEYAYPLRAFRELIANALLHRDLDGWSGGRAVEVRLRRDHLVIINPGGLYGITADLLGHQPATAARNARLVSICQFVRSAESGLRVIEAPGTGIPVVTAELERAGLPPASYSESEIGFTVTLRQRARQAAAGPVLGPTEQAVYRALAPGGRSVAELHAALGLQPPNIRRALRSLAGKNLVSRRGSGRSIWYERATVRP